MTKPSSLAAWQMQPGSPLQISSAKPAIPADYEILIRNKAVALNPIDWLLQESALLPWLDYPAVLGSDVAGEVVAVGARVTRFRRGDRVIGQAVGTSVNQVAQGAFQEQTIVHEDMAAPIPDAVEYAAAAVLPLGLGTAASGLYGKTQLGLGPPSLTPVSNGLVVLVWGGSSSVGCNAVQLAVASGYDCVAVASARHADMLRALGASEVIDRNSPTIVDDVVETLSGRRLAGTLHATGNVSDCFSAVIRCEGSRAVAATLPPPEDRPAEVIATHIIGTSLKDDHVGALIYRDFLPAALASGKFVPAPRARLAGHGLQALQPALEIQKAGVSGEKVVVTLA
jgi:NADPH:quinone reductase-like Zn-dependent oxidoreductase